MGQEEPRHPSLLISAPSHTSVDCPEPTGSLYGERPEIKPDKSTPSCEEKHVANQQREGEVLD